MFLQDPLFGIVYLSVVAALTAGLLFLPRLPFTLVRVAQLGACVIVGVLVGFLLVGFHRDVSGSPPAYPLTGVTSRDQGVAPNHVNAPETGARGAQVSVDVFDVASATQPRRNDTLNIRRGERIKISGWSFDAADNTPCSSVAARVGTAEYALAYGLPRRDVAEYFHDPNRLQTGYSGTLLTGTLHAGHFRVRVFCRSQKGVAEYSTANPLNLNVH